jgi:ABC-2 type transport system permease protein
VKALLALLRKETYHIRRDRRTLAVLILMPIVQVILFGFAIRTDVDRLRLAIVDPSHDLTTEALTARFGATNLFRTVAVLPDASTLETRFRRGEIQVAVLFEPRFGERLGRGLDARLQIVADATEPNTATAAQAYAGAVVGDFARPPSAPAPRRRGRYGSRPGRASVSTRRRRARTSSCRG